jgi:hypothetical protein
MKDTKYYFENGKFVIENYNKAKTFSNFLPGLAGKRGIPLWVFYVNRAQLISSFGLQDKNHPITLFHSANKAYQNVAFDGFRTFIKHENKIYEPFVIGSNFTQKMVIEAHQVSIEETNDNINLKTIVTYFGLPNEPIAALVRKVEVINLNDHEIDFELIDGLTEILPAGVRTDEFKSMSNLLQSWMDVDCIDEGFGFYKLRGSTGDSAEVSVVKDGNFYIGFDKTKRIPLIGDIENIFGFDTSKSYPYMFEKLSIKEIKSLKQVTKNKVPSGFLPLEIKLRKNENYEFFSLIGHTHSLEYLRGMLLKLTNFDYISKKQIEAKLEVDNLLNDVETKTAFPIFDAYIKQNYLDNLLRGGYPIKIGNQIYHIYARKHGDLERDYNFFSLAPEYYSTGPGNFRDVCQNRRLDSMINRDVKWFNILQFGSLIQLDGYNPLSVNGIKYSLNNKVLDSFINKHFGQNKSFLLDFFNKKFTPGDLVNFIERNNIEVITNETLYLDDAVNNSELNIEANFGEGYWIDHFTYFLDLIESYLAIYPDEFEDLYYNQQIFLYFQSPIDVLNQDQKAVISKNGGVRQYGSLRHVNQKENFVKIKDDYYKSNLFTKLLILAINKFSLLDPDGIGVEMEAGKPGWNDAMNGLPGLFGSGVSETIELKRIIDFMLDFKSNVEVNLPVEVYRLYQDLDNSFEYKNRVQARESYRKTIYAGLSGEFKEVNSQRVFSTLQRIKEHIDTTLENVFDEFEGIIPTYLTYQVDEYEKADKSDDDNKFVKPIKFKRKAISPFLEAPARLLKTVFDETKLNLSTDMIKSSNLYDKVLKQYKTSVPLDNETYEIGRVVAFTPGWLERESNFMHMNYKYLLGLLRAKLYEKFFAELKTNFVCFMDPKVYGRSTLENSSFIATSNNPNPKIHGQGFFARLSGSTVEVLNIWAIMMLGEKPFIYQKQNLRFQPRPVLDETFFDENNCVSFRFMKDTEIIYHNEERNNTYEGCEIAKFELVDALNKTSVINDRYLEGNKATKIRDGYYKKIHIYIK